MRALRIVAILGALVASGCARHKADMPAGGGRPGSGASSERAAVTPTNPKLIVTPETGLAGKVARVNTAGRFVVLSFPVGHVPTMDQRLSIYHQGLKAGEVRVTGPQLGDNVVADLLAGEAQVGDEVREN